jgi:2-dehydrotetronate isomerase
MPRFAANLSMMFQEHPFLERFAAARAAGFEGVEFLFPYAFDAAEIAARLRENGLAQALFNMPPGDWDKGERGLAALPGREDEVARAVETALAYAKALGCERLHCMAGLLPADADRTKARSTFVANLRHAAEACGRAGVTLVIEPINTRDMPGYFLNYQRDGRAIIDEVGADNLKLQLDLYHCQIMEGDLATHLREFLPVTGHVQVAGVPERHEPDVGEVNYPYLLELLDHLGYAGWVGCEYRPRGRTEDGLGWFQPYRQRPA